MIFIQEEKIIHCFENHCSEIYVSSDLMFKQNDISLLEKFTATTKYHNITIWFGHYPLSVTAAPSHLREKIK